MASITWDDPLLAKFNFREDEQEKVEAMIAAVDAAVDTYTKRNLAEATYSRLCPVLSNGDVLLKAYPVTRLIRVQHERLEVVTIRTTAAIGIASTSTAALFLQALSNGVLVPTTLSYATYPTLTQLVAAINNVSGFTATVDTGYGDYPSSDLVSGYQSSGESMRFAIHTGNGDFCVDEATGILHLGFKSYDKIKVSWVGGYSDYPDDLKSVIADLVGNVYSGKVGSVVSESFGGEYSYTIAPLATQSIPVTNKIILDSYKDRN